MKTNFKYERIAEDIKEILTKTLNEEVGGCEYVSITDVIITKDTVLRTAGPKIIEGKRENMKKTIIKKKRQTPEGSQKETA